MQSPEHIFSLNTRYLMDSSLFDYVLLNCREILGLVFTRKGPEKDEWLWECL